MIDTTFAFWKRHHSAPYHFPMNEETWRNSMKADVDSDGKKLFDSLTFQYDRAEGAPSDVFDGMIAYGRTAFGFSETGEMSDAIHHKVIRDLCFDPMDAKTGQHLLNHALDDLGQEDVIYAFFHYFGMTGCARHGKLHESQTHIHDLLLKNGFTIEHENVYYSRTLCECEKENDLFIQWKPLNQGGCREFAAVSDGQEIGWGQIHFLPQGNIAYLRWIYIAENQQHRGYGQKTLHALFHTLSQMEITRFDTDTALNNKIAQHLYEKCGFRNEGITRSYHRLSPK